MTKRTVFILFLFLAIVVLAGLSEPTSAGVAAKDNPSGPGVLYNDDTYHTPTQHPFGVYHDIYVNSTPTISAHDCRVRVKWGNLQDAYTNPEAFGQMQQTGGNSCRWGGVHIKYMEDGVLRDALGGSYAPNDWCVGNPTGTLLDCAQLSDGSVFMMPLQTIHKARPVVQAEFIVCAGYANWPTDNWLCHHEINYIAF